MPGGRQALYRALTGVLLWAFASDAQAPPPRPAKAVYLIAFPGAQTGDLGDLGGFATTTLRLRLAGINSLKYLDSQDGTPCHQSSAAGSRASTPGMSESAAVAPVYYLVSGSVDVRYQEGKAPEINLSYSLDEVERCQVKNLLQSRVPMAPAEALARFRSMADVIALRLEEELSDRAAVAVEPVATSATDEQTQSSARLFQQLLARRLADSGDFRQASGDDARASARYRLLSRIETKTTGGTPGIDSLKLRIETGGKVHNLPAISAPADQTRGAMLDFFGDAADSALQALARIRYWAESGLPDDPGQVATSVVVSKAGDYVGQGQPRAALALLSGLPPNRPLTVEALAVKARALFDTADFLASGKAYDDAAAAARNAAPIVQARMLYGAGAAWYRAREYSNAAARYGTLLALARGDTAPVAEVKTMIRESARWRVASLGLAGQADQALEEYPRLRTLVDDPSGLDDEAKRVLDGIASIPQLRRATERLEPQLGPDPPVLSRSWQRIGDDFYAARDFEQARVFYQRALQSAEKQTPPDPHQVATLSNLLGNAFMATSRVRDAIPYYQKAIEKLQGAGPSEDDDLVAIFRNLASALESNGAYDRAEAHLKTAKSIAATKYGAGSPRVAEVDVQLGSLYASWGKYPEADLLLSSAVRVFENQSPRDDSLLFEAYRQLGWLRCETYNPRDAESLFGKAKSLLESRGETETFSYGLILDNLSTALELKGEYAQATSSERSALELDAKLGNPDSVATSTFNLCNKLFSLQSYREAASECEKARDSYLTIYDAGHWKNAYTMLALAEIHSAQAMFSVADQLFSEGLKLYAASPAMSRTRMLDEQTDVGWLRYRQGRYSEVEGSVKGVREALIQEVGSRYLGVAELDDLLGWTFFRLGRPQAESKFQAVIEFFEDLGLPDHPRAASGREGLARLALAGGHPDRAESLCKRALDARLKAFGYDSEAVADSVDCLGLVSTAQGAYPAAAAHFERALAAYEKTFGPQHPKIAETLEHFAALRKATGETAESARLANRASAIRAAFRMP